jgi:catechol-2,3-dioxygenase
VGRTPIRGFGEIALRVRDLAAMRAFYEEVVGLEVLGTFPHTAFFRIADGVAGHTQVLALFDRSPLPADEEPSHARTTLDHLAFGIALEEYAAERARLAGLGLAVRTAEHAWVHWRSLYVSDPEGNVVEWVCYDEKV